MATDPSGYGQSPGLYGGDISNPSGFLGILGQLYNQYFPGGLLGGLQQIQQQGQRRASVPDILAPTTGTGIQPQPSQMPQPQQPQAGPAQLGGFDLGTIGPGLDPGAGTQLPAQSQPTQQQATPGFGGGYGPTLGPSDFGLMPGPFGNLQAFGSNFTSGGNPIAGTLNAIGGLLTGQRTDAVGVARQQALAQYNMLIRSGVDPGRALAMIQRPEIMSNYYDTKQLGSVRNAAGEEVPVISSQGQVGPLAGSGFMSGGMDKLREKAQAEELGKAQGQAQGALPNTTALFDKGIEDIDAAIKDPNLGLATGIPHLVGLDRFGPGAESAARLHQISGESAIAGLSYLKGIGRLNINEFNAGKEAIARLNQAQNKESMISALQDLRGVYTKARERAGVTAGVGPTPTPQSTAQPTYTQQDLVNEARRRGLIQ